MKSIEVKLLNPEAMPHIERMMVAMARLTQGGEKIHSMDDFMELYSKDYTQNFVERLSQLPHKTLKRFGCLDIIVVGASRRFLAQITRHQAGVAFMSASLQYSDYSGKAEYCVPYEFIRKDAEREDLAALKPGYYTRNYLNACKSAMDDYKWCIESGVDHDTAASMTPEGLRNTVLISANPLEWLHIINQRICNRNTLETQYVILKCWEQLYPLSLIFQNAGADCMLEGCREGKMACGQRLPRYATPTGIINERFKWLCRPEDSNNEHSI